MLKLLLLKLILRNHNISVCYECNHNNVVQKPNSTLAAMTLETPRQES